MQQEMQQANCNKVAPDIKVEKLRINKIIEMLVSAESEEEAREQLDLLSDRLFANVVIEDWEYDLLMEGMEVFSWFIPR